MNNIPNLGFGLGLRSKHYPYILENKPEIDWFEIISENYMDTEGRPKYNLAQIKELYPIVMHGVAMSIGTVDPLNSEYLKKLKKLIRQVEPVWISDHLCWTGVAHKNTHDLLPVPYTEEALNHIIKRIKHVQDFLERPIAFENPSTYLEFKNSQIPEAEFIATMAKESGCNLLLDVNNVYVTCYNHRLDPQKYLDAIPMEHVVQIHLSGHTNKGNYIIDTHDDYVVDEVWNLYKYVVSKAGYVPNTMIEWDGNIPDFTVLEAELDKARDAANNSDDYIIPNIDIGHSIDIVSDKTRFEDSQHIMQNSIINSDTKQIEAKEWIIPKENFSSQEQLNVYINAYSSRLYDVVEEDYPILKNYLGDAKFRELIINFIDSQYPEHYNIARFALKLPKFIQINHSNDLFAYELCTLETEITKIADLPEILPLEQKHLTAVTPEDLMELTIKPRKALQLYKFDYPINKYYLDVVNNKYPKNPNRENSYTAVFRHDNTVWRMDLEKEEYNLLNKLFMGITIGQALSGMDESEASNISKWFSRWIQNGLLAA